jgi:tRNA-modifying protein YgfZ
MGTDDNHSMSETVSESAALPHGVCRLTDRGVIRASGADAAKLLHSQLSNDFALLDSGHARLSAYCNPQGRMLASFIGFKRSADDIWLACSADLLAATLKRLQMFVLRSQAKLVDASQELLVVGLAGDAARCALGDAAADVPWEKRDTASACVVRLAYAAGQPRWLWIGPAADARTLEDALPALHAEHWQWLEVMSGMAGVSAATAGQFVPQMLNYDIVGGVDFKKGCYPGQEVVARSQYLGKLKRRAYLLHADVPMRAAQEVFWSGDANQPAGLVALAAAHPRAGFDAIVELKSAVLADGSLHLGSTSGPRLVLRELPYALPTQDKASAA